MFGLNGRTADRDRAVELGAHTSLDPETEKLEDAGEVDVIGGDTLREQRGSDVEPVRALLMRLQPAWRHLPPPPSYVPGTLCSFHSCRTSPSREDFPGWA